MPRFPYTEVVGETDRAWIMKMPAKKFPVRVPKQGTVIDWEHRTVTMQDDAAEFLGLVNSKGRHTTEKART